MNCSVIVGDFISKINMSVRTPDNEPRYFGERGGYISTKLIVKVVE